MKKNIISLLLLISVSAIVSGCGIHDGEFKVLKGREFSSSDLTKIQKNVTTRLQILNLFGEPYSKEDDTWRYYLLKERTSTDRRWFGIPLKYHQRFEADLMIYFKGDIVRNFTYSKRIIEY